MQPIRTASLICSGILLAIGCAEAGETSTVPGIDLADGYEISTAVDDLDGPTQIAHDRAGGFVVAELNGGERDGTGRVLHYAQLDADAGEVIVEGLLAPTGVTVDVDDRLWIMERRTLSAAPLDRPGERTVVLDEMPFNGRSEGTVTALEAGGVLYNTSGSRAEERPAELRPGSGSLWTIADPGTEPVEFATGFKHAYAHVVDADGTVWSTEMSDGRLDGEVPSDELVAVSPGDDFGYPTCVGDRVPVAELGADDAACADTPRSHAVFQPSATPTSVSIAPWDPEVLLVALWNRGEIVAVPRTPDGAPHEPEVIVAGDLTPQHLLADGDRLLITDFGSGRVLVLTRS